MDQHFDYVIIGGGMSGLSLAQEMIDSRIVPDSTLLILEPRDDYRRDKIWSFWDVDDTDYSSITLKSWSMFSLHNENDTVTVNPSCKYISIDSELFYRQIINKIENQPMVTLRTNTGVIEIMTQSDGSVMILLDTRDKIIANQVFDSRPPGSLPSGKYDLLQHFKGIHVSTENPRFNPDEVILMDFRSNQQWGLHFIYVLPFSDTEALIEATWFSHETVNENVYDQMLEKYLVDHEINNFEVKYEEHGIIPMTTAIQQQQNWSSIIDIGTRGGLTRPSTGYTFLFAQWFSKQIVQELDKPLKNRSIPQMRSGWINFIDEILLRVLSDHPKLGPSIFIKLFKRHPSSRIISFLSGTSTISDELWIMAKVPHKWAFIKAGMFGFFNRLKPW